METSTAVEIALRHIDAWTSHDWTMTREMLCEDVHALVMNTQPGFARTVEFTGIEDYMVRKVKAAQMIDPGSLEVVSTYGDATSALVMVTFKIAMGPGGSMVTMARSCLYTIDSNYKIKEERDGFLLLGE